MELYDSLTENKIYDSRFLDKNFMRFMEITIEEYLCGQFIVLKNNYESAGIMWVNYSTIYAELRNVINNKLVQDEIHTDNIGKCGNMEYICRCILNKFVKLYRMPRIDSIKYVEDAYIFLSITECSTNLETFT